MIKTLEIYFRDSKPPHEIKFHLERDLMTLFQTDWDGSRLAFKGTFKYGAVPYDLELRYEAALGRVNCYLLRVVSADTSAESWFKFWTRDFKRTAPPGPGEDSPERYRAIAGQAISAEAHLVDVSAVQQAILEAMRKGAKFSTSHKEGGTNISWQGSLFGWQGSCFVRADYGESSLTETYRDEASFLAFLRQFYDWETSRSFYPEKAPELVAWKLILRLVGR